MSYYMEAMEIRNHISQGDENLGILFKDLEYVRSHHGINGGSEPGWLLEKITMIISYFSFGRFLIISMVFATLAYTGMIKMLETFTDLMPEWHERIAFIVLFFPSVAVYGSGILKDTLCITALGWLIYYCHKLFVKKIFKFSYLFIILFCIIIIAVIKVYIIAAFIVPLFLYIMLSMLKKIENVFLRRIMQPLVFGLMVLVYIIFSQQIDASLGGYASETIFKTVTEQQNAYKELQEESGSFFEMAPMEQSLAGFIKKIPEGITATLFRPFIWESKKIIMLFSALESLFILLFTLYVLFKVGIVKFFSSIFSDPFIFLCIMFSLLFAALVGVSTLNFGTLARYRIPIIPFYLTGLLYILYNQEMPILKKLHENIF